MLGHTKKHRTEKPLEASFIGSHEKIVKLRDYAMQIGLLEAGDTVTIPAPTAHP